MSANAAETFEKELNGTSDAEPEARADPAEGVVWMRQWKRRLKRSRNL